MECLFILMQKCSSILALTMTHPKMKQCWCISFCIHPRTCLTSWTETTKYPGDSNERGGMGVY